MFRYILLSQLNALMFMQISRLQIVIKTALIFDYGILHVNDKC